MVGTMSRVVPRWWAALAILAALGLVTCRAGAVGTEDRPPDEVERPRILHHSLSARIDPVTAHIEVVDTLTIRFRSGAGSGTVPPKEFPVLLAKDLAIQQVSSPDAQVRFREGRMRPRDYWQHPPYDELAGFERARSVVLEYGGPAKSWPESVRVVIAFAGTIYDTLRAPVSAYARGFEETAGLIDARGAYLFGATFWIPVRPDERFTFRAELNVPAGWRSVSQGDLVHSTVDAAGSATDVWNCPQPMEEIYFIAGPYTLRSEQRRGVDVMTYTYASTDEALCKRYIDGTERYLDLYGELIGPYPFGKFALVENFWQTGFGMPSFTLLGDQVIRLPFILDTSYGHEILHNWWGNGVFVEYESGNWCEGLTTYGADYLYKERQSPEEAKDYRRTTLQGYLDYVSESEDMPLRAFRQRSDFSTQAIGYGKSMMVFHQMRRMLGDDAFVMALRNVYHRFLFRRASWDDFFEEFSAVSSRDLSAVKTQWLDRTGAPALAVEVARPVAVPGGYETTVTVRQTQDPFYELLVPVQAVWSGGAAESTVVVAMTEAESQHTVRIRTAKSPDWVAVDPGFDVLRRIDPAEIPPALSRVLGADSVVVVVASSVPPDLEAAYLKVAASWDEGARLAVFREADIHAGASFGVPQWYFGLGPRATARIDDLPGAVFDASGGWIVDGSRHPAQSGVVLAGGPPDDVLGAFAMLIGNTPSQIAALGRKVPHYGKYGYLVFEETTNVAKGTWPVTRSPLRVNLQGGQ